jgi:hypothetical protein
MLPNRLRSGSTVFDQTPHVAISARGKSIAVPILIALAALLVVTNVLTLVDYGFHAKAYQLVETVARATGLGTSLEGSPAEVNRRALEIAARQSAEEAIRRQRVATMALVASLLVLVDATHALLQQHNAVKLAYGSLAATSRAVARRVAVRTAGSATRSVTTLAGKALPYVGAASVLALTAYDLADACQTLKDANELEVATGASKGGEEEKFAD